MIKSLASETHFCNVCNKKMDKKEQTCAYALSRIMTSSPRIAREAVEKAGGASPLFGMRPEQLVQFTGGNGKYAESVASADLGAYEKELDAILAEGYRYIIYNSPHFPARLGECCDAPLGLFVLSCDSDEAIFSRESISIVGTRDITPYGKDWCRRVVESLALSSARPSIVSGLAFGSDITAHLAALENGLPTIAVMGTGISEVYPAAHRGYAGRIAATAGCALVSEYPPCAEVFPVNFLSRNRIIAGLSTATVLVESRIKGGGMSTARTAFSYGREVFALPGRNCDIRSQGCNYLIHRHIAEPIIGCDEFLKSLGYGIGGKGRDRCGPQIRKYYSGCMDEGNISQCERLMKEILGHGGISVEELAALCGIPYKETSSLVRRLENDGFIEIDLLQQCSAGRGKPE